MADLGKSTWDDDISIDSDSYIFTKKLYDISRTTEDLSASAKIMAYGWRDHYIQDQYGNVYNTSSPYLSGCPGRYRLTCGWIDEYLRDEIQLVSSPIQNGDIDEMYISYKLIKLTYEALSNISPTIDDIQNEILDMFALYDLQIGLNALGWYIEDEEAIAAELLRTMDLCPGIVKDDPANYQNRSSQNHSVDVISIKDFVADSDIEKLTDYMVLKETPISDSEAYISISIKNKSAYYDKLDAITTKYKTALLKQEAMK